MIYLNNAATSYPKPQPVLDAHAAALSLPPQGQFRGGMSRGENVWDTCRQELGKLFQIADWQRIYFTSGATLALNTLILGLGLEGEEVLFTQSEHNSVLRPLYNHPDIQAKMIPCYKTGEVKLEELKKLLSEKTKAVIINHCSNVTGVIQDIRKISKIVREYEDIKLILDASQSAGAIEICTQDWDLDALVFTGHKSLYGVQGTGGFYIKRGLGLKPLCYGGTGRDSKKLIYEKGEYEYEVGTQNGAGICALLEGIRYIEKQKITEIEKKEKRLVLSTIEELKRIPKVSLYCAQDEKQGPVFSFNIQGLQAVDVAYILQNAYGIVVRAGFHCAPLIHEALGTIKSGTVRVSVSDFTTEEDIYSLLQAIEDIVKSL